MLSEERRRAIVEAAVHKTIADKDILKRDLSTLRATKLEVTFV